MKTKRWILLALLTGLLVLVMGCSPGNNGTDFSGKEPDGSQSISETDTVSPPPEQTTESDPGTDAPVWSGDVVVK